MQISNWQEFIAMEKQQQYFQHIDGFLETEHRCGKHIYPPKEEIYAAFDLTPMDKVKVVLLGQDPYHGAGQAHGLCFSVKPEIKIPPSLVNIYKELVTDIEGFQIPQHGYLVNWAKQGVLMLNTVLTVEQGKAHSHANIGWETFTSNALSLLNKIPQPIIFILWGSHAFKKAQVITSPHHILLKAPHPSPLSAYRGFFGCQHFSQVNRQLIAWGKQPIDWQV